MTKVMRLAGAGYLAVLLAAPIGWQRSANADAEKAARTQVATVLSAPIYADEIEPSPGELESLVSEGGGEGARGHLRARALEGKIVEPLRRRFCAEHGCEPTGEEMAVVNKMLGTASTPSGAESQHSSSPPNATGEPRTGAPKQAVSEGAAGVEEDMTRNWVGGWKFHRELYAKYGGKVISQVMGPNAVGAYRRWLEANLDYASDSWADRRTCETRARASRAARSDSRG